MRSARTTARTAARAKTGLTACLVLAALLSDARARPPVDARTVPADAWMVFSVPDVAAAWGAFRETPLYQETARLLKSPAFTAFSGYGKLVAQQRQIEAELGFPLTADTLSQMIDGFDLVFLPPPGRDRPPLSVCIVHVADAARFRRLADYVSQRMENAGPTAAPGTAAAARPKHRGIEIVSSPDGEGFALAELAPDLFILGSHPDAVRRIIDQTRGRQGLAKDSRFRAAVGGLQENDPHGFLYLNTERAARVMHQGGQAGQTLSKIVRSLGNESALAADFRIEPQAIRFESFLPFSDPAKNRLASLYRHNKPGELRAYDLISSAPLMFTARNTLDGLALYDSLRRVVLTSMQVALPPGKRAEQEIERAELEFRDQMGFDLHDDLAAAVGPGFFVSFEDLRFDPLLRLPMIDLVTGVQVRDAERMDKVLAGFEAFLEKQLGPGAGDGGRRHGFQVTEYRGKPVRRFPLPRAPLFTVGYSQAGDFLVIGLGRETVERTMDRAAGENEGYAAGHLYDVLQPHMHKRVNEVFVLNVEKIVAVVREIVRRFAKGDAAQVEDVGQVESLLRGLGPVMAFGASTAGSEAGLHTRGAVVFRPPAKKVPPPK